MPLTFVSSRGGGVSGGLDNFHYPLSVFEEFFITDFHIRYFNTNVRFCTILGAQTFS